MGAGKTEEHYSFCPVDRKGIIEQIKKDYSHCQWEKSSNMEYTVTETRLRVDIYKERIDFHGNGCVDVGAYYRKMDMQKDVSKAVTVAQKGEENDECISIAELNFEKRVIGSDETGKMEADKQMTVVAAYVQPENMDELIRLGVEDSKGIKTDNKLIAIGMKLTGITSYEQFLEKEGTVIQDGIVPFCVSILTNEAYNERCINQGENVEEVQKEQHRTVVRALAGKVEYDYVVVDDFLNGREQDGMTDELETSKEKTILRTHADSCVMAVSCASVISAYISNLYQNLPGEKVVKNRRLKKS